MLRTFLVLIAVLFAIPAWAQDGPTFFEIGGDTFRAGRSVTHDTTGTDDLFMAGENVQSKTDIAGSAHLAGREVIIDGDVQGDAYAVGDTVKVGGDITGDATIFGRDLSVSRVSGDLRMAGSKLHLTGEIDGYALVAGEDVKIDAVIAGDLSLSAKKVEWGDQASVAGNLVVYENTPGELQVPEGIVPADRIERREISEWDGPRPPSVRRAIASFLMGVIVVAALAALVAALVPERLAEMRRQVLARPLRTLWLGFLAQSAVIGAGVLLAITVIGLLLVPAFVFVALAAGFAGYVVAAYAFGVGLLMALGLSEPETIKDRALAAGVGALAAGVIGLVPLLGWIFVLCLVLVGIGAITVRLIRPAFFSNMA